MAVTDKKTGVWGLDQVYNKINQGDIWPAQKNFYGWGSNAYGLLATSGLPIGSPTKRSSPVQLFGNDFTKIFSSNANATMWAVKADGTLWGWGNNGFPGKLGLNDQANRSSPTQVPGTTWVKAQTGLFGSLGNKSDGTLWAWGYNNEGQLGDNDSTRTYSPKQIPGSWSTSEYGMATSGEARFAIKADGTLWAWGKNDFGGLGINDRTSRSSPTQIPGTTWASVDMSYSSNEGVAAAVKTDGTAWVWGWNDNGQLGLNQAVSTKYSSPVQLPGTTWTRIQSNGSDMVVGLKTNGTIWAWGQNYNGNLGHNNRTQYSSPVQIGGGTDWNDIQITANATVGSKTDGTLWVWGNSASGMLGHNDSGVKYSSPTQIPGTWDDVAMASSTMFGIKD